MAAGQGFKTFTTGEVLTSGDVNGYLMQGINVFTNATARDAAITAPAEGQFAFTKDNNSLWYYDGAAWVASGATGDIEGVTAGVGISGGGTSGTVTVTNSMATAIDAKGDLVPGTGADTFARLAVGANDTVLTADSTAATGLKWATPAAAGMTLLSTTSFSGSSITVSSINQTYRNLVIEFANVTATSDYTYRWRPNGNDDSSNINAVRAMNTTVVNYAIGNGSNWVIDNTYNFLSNSTTNKVTLTIYDYASTTTYKNYTLIGSAQRSNTQWMSTNEIGTIVFNDAFSSLGIVSGATFNGGTIKIYGVK